MSSFSKQSRPRHGASSRPNKPRKKLNKYAIFPDYWKKQWGRRPLLGYVYAEDEFDAVRRAYDVKTKISEENRFPPHKQTLLTMNCTFGPKPVLMKEGESLKDSRGDYVRAKPVRTPI